MHQITDRLTRPEDHLALDEAMLLQADEGIIGEAMRVWEFPKAVVVAGRGTRVDREIDRSFCQSRGIPILRRCSGGASIVGGPGCLMYSVVLSIDQRPELGRIDAAHQHVMSRVLQAVQRQVALTELQGTCDLTWNDRKCSGNSLRIARRHLLYHGTVLYDYDLSLIPKCLRVAPRQPEYRRGRDHDAFVTNVPMDRRQFEQDICEVFETGPRIDAESLRDRIRRLCQDRYDAPSWHFRH